MAEARRNRVLASLPETELDALLPTLERIDLAVGQVLAEPGRMVSHVWLPLDAVISLMVVTAEGGAAEGASVGREGAVGSVAGPVDRGAFTRIAVGVPGAAVRLGLAALETARGASPALDAAFDRNSDALLAQLLQSVACNALHPIAERLSRWLLTTLDRVAPAGSEARSGEVPLSQEAIAVMLGAHRVTVSDSLAALEGEGLLRRGRRRVVILDHGGLERRACGCYGVVRDHLDRLLPENGRGG